MSALFFSPNSFFEHSSTAQCPCLPYTTVIVMFNLFHGILPIQLQRRFTKYSSVHSSRQNKSFVMVQVNTNLKVMCLFIYGVKLWNTLPDDIIP